MIDKQTKADLNNNLYNYSSNYKNNNINELKHDNHPKALSQLTDKVKVKYIPNKALSKTKIVSYSSKNNKQKENKDSKEKLMNLHQNEIQTILYLSKQIHLNEDYLNLFFKKLVSLEFNLQQIFLNKEIDSIKNISNLISKIKKENLIREKSFQIIKQIEGLIKVSHKDQQEQIDIKVNLNLDDKILQELKSAFNNFFTYSFNVVKYFLLFRDQTSFDYINRKFDMEKFKTLLDSSIIIEIQDNISSLKNMNVFTIFEREAIDINEYYNCLYSLNKEQILLNLYNNEKKANLVSNRITLNSRIPSSLSKKTDHKEKNPVDEKKTKLSKSPIPLKKVNYKLSSKKNVSIVTMDDSKTTMSVNNSTLPPIPYNHKKVVYKQIDKVKPQETQIMNKHAIESEFSENVNRLQESVIKEESLKTKLKKKLDSNKMNEDETRVNQSISTIKEKEQKMIEDIESISNHQQKEETFDLYTNIKEDNANSINYDKSLDEENIDNLLKEESEINIEPHIDEFDINSTKYDFYLGCLDDLKDTYNYIKLNTPSNQIKSFLFKETLQEYENGLYPKIVQITNLNKIIGFCVVTVKEDIYKNKVQLKIEVLSITEIDHYTSILNKLIDFLYKNLEIDEFLVELSYFKQDSGQNQIDSELKASFEKLNFKWRCVANEGEIRKIRYGLSLNLISNDNDFIKHSFLINNNLVVNLHLKEEAEDYINSEYSYMIKLTNFDNNIIYNNETESISPLLINHLLFELSLNKKLVISNKLIAQLNTDKYRKAARTINSFSIVSPKEVMTFLSSMEIIYKNENSQKILSSNLMLSNSFLLKTLIENTFNSKRSLLFGDMIINKIKLFSIELFINEAFPDDKFYFLRNELEDNAFVVCEVSTKLNDYLQTKDESQFEKYKKIQENFKLVESFQNKEIYLPAFNISKLTISSPDHNISDINFTSKDQNDFIITQSISNTSISFLPDSKYQFNYEQELIPKSDDIIVSKDFLFICVNSFVATECNSEAILVEIVSSYDFYYKN